MMSHQNDQQNISLVKGFIKNNDQQPMIAKQNGLHDRFCIVFHTEHLHEDGLSFNIELFDKIFSKILPTFCFNKIVVEYDETYTFESIKEVLHWIVEKEKTGEYLCKKILLYEKDILTVLINSEDYTSAGGIFPYHDAINFSIFQEKVDHAYLEKLIMQLSIENHFTIQHTIIGLQRPSETLLHRIKKIL